MWDRIAVLGRWLIFSPYLLRQGVFAKHSVQSTFCLSFKAHFWVGSVLECILENKCWLRRSVLFFYHSKFNLAAALLSAYNVLGIERWIKYSLLSNSSQLTRIDSLNNNNNNNKTLVSCDSYKSYCCLYKHARMTKPIREQPILSEENRKEM